jgi:outer membrane lipoprotein SlyB
VGGNDDAVRAFNHQAYKENAMTDNTLPTRSTSRLPVAAMIGAGVLVASLGAAAGWMMHANNAAPSVQDSARMALAPNETVLPPSAGTTAPAAQPGVAAPVAPATAQNNTAARSSRHHAAGATGAQPRQAPSNAGTGNAATPLSTQHVASCDNCGVVEGVRAVQRKGQGSGVGMVAGGVLGGAIGNQVGHGNGRAAMTVLGAIGGGLAGNEVEKRMHTETVYEVRVRLDDGSVRTLTERTAPTPGSRVVVEGNSLRVVSGRGTDSGGGMQQTSDRGV